MSDVLNVPIGTQLVFPFMTQPPQKPPHIDYYAAYKS